MIKVAKSIILAILASCLSAIIMPTGIVVAFWFMIVRFDKNISIKYLDRLFFNIAISLDILGNFVCAILFNLTLIKNNQSAYRFGKEGETISSSLGKNLLAGNLTLIGRALNSVLNLLDRNHSIKSINNQL